MFLRSVACFICVSVVLVTAANHGDPGHTTGSDPDATVYGSRTEDTEPPLMEPAQEVVEVAAVDLGTLLDAGYGATVTLVAGDTRLVAHRAVLVARSPVFAATFRREDPEAGGGQVAVDGVEGAVLRQLLVYLYTLRPPRLPATAAQLLAAADRFGVAALKAECERQVAQQLSVEGAAAAAVLAVRHNAPSLRQAALAFIKAHTHEVMATRGWADAVRTHPEDLIRVSQLLSGTSEDTSAPPPPPPAAADDTATPPTPPTAAARGSPLPGDAAASRTQGLTAEEKSKRLIEAVKEGAVEEVQALLEAGADVGARDGNGATALHWAAWRGRAEAARLLLAAGADPSARGEAGWAPLHFATHGGHREVAATLLAAGADRAAANSAGEIPLDIARQNGHQPLVDMLS